MYVTGEGGVKKSENVADVIYESFLMPRANFPPLCSFAAASPSFSHLRGTKHVHPAKPRCGFGRKGGMKVAPPAPFSLSFSQYLTYKGLQYLILKRKGVGLCWLKGI